MYSTQWAEPQAHTSRQAQSREAEALAQHSGQGEGRAWAWAADAEAASAAYAGRWGASAGGQQAAGATPTCVTRDRRRGSARSGLSEGVRPKTSRCNTRSGSVSKARPRCWSPPVAPCGWRVLATTVREQTYGEAEMVRADRDPTTVEPGCRWSKNPAALSPVWRETPPRMAAVARLTVVGLLVSSLSQRQVRQYVQQPQQSIPGKQGATAMPTATVVLEAFTHVTRVQLALAGVEVRQVHGWQERHRLICQALGVDVFGYEGAADQKIHPTRLRAP